MVLPAGVMRIISQSKNVCIVLRNVGNIKSERNKKKEDFLSRAVEPVFVHFCQNIMSGCVALTKPSCAECCAHITVFHKLNGSESVAVRRYLMLVV